MPEFARHHDDFFSAAFFEDVRDQLRQSSIDAKHVVVSGAKKAEGLVAIVHMDLTVDYWKRIAPSNYVRIGGYPEMNVEDAIRAAQSALKPTSAILPKAANTDAAIKLARTLAAQGWNDAEIEWHLNNPGKTLGTLYI